jgi:precorrin-6B methylase 1
LKPWGFYRDKRLCSFDLVIQKEKKKSEWVKQWLQKRDTLSNISLIAELRVSSDVDLKNYLQMTDACFKGLLNLLKLHTEKQNARTRTAISAEERLTATLRFLATGQNFEDLKFITLISHQVLA